MGRTTGNAIRIYQITYIFGFVLGSILYITVNKIFPPPGIGIAEPFSEGNIVEGVAPSDEGSNESMKEVADISQKQINEDAAV
jgi:NCS1 family nucleobase:cation symporter-1